MVIAELDYKYVSACDTSFYWKDFSSRLHLIKTNTTLNSGIYKIFAWIYFLRREIKKDIAQTGFRYYLNWNYHLDVQLAIIYLIKKWFDSSNQIINSNYNPPYTFSIITY